EGGQPRNPSTAELVAAIDAVAAPEVILLPNNSNVILAAEQAVALAAKPVEVIRTDTIQSGLAAMVVFDASRSAAENAAEMRAALASVATGEVTIASRDVELNGLPIRKGNYFGLVGDDPVAEGESFDEVAGAVEDTAVFREALELLLGRRSDIDVVASVADGIDAVPACLEHSPEVILMDFRMPGLDGVQATAAVRATCPEVAVVCLTASATG